MDDIEQLLREAHRVSTTPVVPAGMAKRALHRSHRRRQLQVAASGGAGIAVVGAGAVFAAGAGGGRAAGQPGASGPSTAPASRVADAAAASPSDRQVPSPAPGGTSTAPATASPNGTKWAHVLGSGRPTGSDQSITINLGSQDGVHINMTVVNNLGLVGNVVGVHQTTASVQLLTDAAMYVRVRNARTNVTGFVTGQPDGKLDVTQIGETSAIRVGDELVTAGSTNGEPYVPDYPVGVVTSVSESSGTAPSTAVVQPYVRFDALDLVEVIFPGTVARSYPPSGDVRPAPSAIESNAPTAAPASLR